MTYTKVLTALVFSLTLACNNNDDNSNTNPGNDNGGTANDIIEQTDLVGNWNKGCEASGVAGFRNDSLVFDATTVQLVTQVHQSDSTCTGTSDFEARANFNYTVPTFDPAANNNIDLVLNNIRAKFNSPLATNAANAADFCGFDDWAVGVEKDVTGRDCIEELPDSGGQFFQIFKLETEDRLFVGQVDSAHDGESAAERPNALESKPYVRVGASVPPTTTSTTTTTTTSSTLITISPTTISTTLR